MTHGTNQSTFPRQWVKTILGDQGIGQGTHAAYSEISTDSRTLLPCSLFAAIKGENFDGEDFISAAIKAGATGVLCSLDAVNKYKTQFPNIDFFVAQDSVIGALRILAKSWLETMNIKVIAVTGSVGKTTTKDLISVILRQSGANVLSTEKSENGFLGIAKTLLRLRAENDHAVIEVGIDEIGAMKKHLEIVQPQYTILTAIAEEHLHQLKDLETVTQEEMLSLAWTFDHGGTVFVNLADQIISNTQFSKKKDQRIITFGTSGSGADYEVKGKDQDFEIQFGGKSTNFESSLRGPHNLINQLGAITVAHSINVPIDVIQDAITSFKPSFGRTQIEQANGITYICDYYNANPASVRAALDTLDEIGTRDSHKWICLGDMLELGNQEETLHRSLAKPLIEAKLEGICLFGNRMKSLEDELKKSGYKGRLGHFSDKTQIASTLKKELSRGDVVLLKGSRGMKMEDIFEHLK